MHPGVAGRARARGGAATRPAGLPLIATHVPPYPGRAGATELRRIGGEDPGNAALVGLYADAYTLLELDDAEKRRRYEEGLRATADDEGTVRLAAYRDGVLVGAMRWYDFTMRLRDRDVFAGGLGAVAVSFDARRRGVGRDLVGAFVETYRRRGAVVALLHPFRHDFYRRYGFGYGTKMNAYRVDPASLPQNGDAGRVRQVDASMAPALAACYERVRQRTNGLIATSASDFRRRLERQGLRAFAYFGDGGDVRGFVLARPYVGEPKTANANELRVYEPIVEGTDALLALLAYLRALRDQFRTIAVETQDDAFHFLLDDPRDGSGRIVQPPAYHATNVQGSGVMYRVLDVARALEAAGAQGGRGGVRATFSVADALIPQNGAPFEVALGAEGGEDVAVSLNVAEFSSFIVGSATLRALERYGLATFSRPGSAALLDRRFAADRPPLCTTAF
jgi:predicted acetyltransferase